MLRSDYECPGKKLQIVTQLTALALFITLLVTGRIQVWMGIFLASVVLTLFFGRIYCGWICPNNTVMKLVTGIKARFKLKSFAVPELLKKPAFRYGMLAAFLLAFILTMVSGKRLPVLPILFAAGVLLTVFFPEVLWHRYLCPYGTISSLPGPKPNGNYGSTWRFARNAESARRSAPAGQLLRPAVLINKSLCLNGRDCAGQCPKQAIRYQ